MKAIVSYHFAGEEGHIMLLGSTEIETVPFGAPLTVGCRVKFGVDRKTEVGTVETVLPDPNGPSLPWVTIRLNKPAPKEKLRR